MLKPPASYCVWGRRCWSRCIENHAVSFRNLCVICYIGLFCIFFVSLPHNDISVFSNMCISSLLVLNGWRRRRHGILYFRIFSMYTLKFVCEKLQHTTSTCTNLIRTSLLYFFGKTLFSAKYRTVLAWYIAWFLHSNKKWCKSSAMILHVDFSPILFLKRSPVIQGQI